MTLWISKSQKLHVLLQKKNKSLVDNFIFLGALESWFNNLQYNASVSSFDFISCLISKNECQFFIVRTLSLDIQTLLYIHVIYVIDLLLLNM
jgi:hypothetical protein